MPHTPRDERAPMPCRPRAAAAAVWLGLAAAVGPAGARPDAAPAISPQEQQAYLSALSSRMAPPPPTPRAFCYPNDLPPDVRRAIIDRYKAWPWADVLTGGERFVTGSQGAWTLGGVGNTGQAQPAALTYSFVPDGATWGLGGGIVGPSELGARFIALFGPLNLDRGRELVRQSFAGWRRVASISYSENPDDGSPMSTDTARLPTRGDIRVGGLADNGQNYLAYSYYPLGGGDVFVNTAYFFSTAFGSPTNNYRYFRNVLSHEHGHALGYFHVVPCDQTKLMEPFVITSIDQLSVDEIRGAESNYGDRFAGNTSAATARDFGSLTSPALRSVIERELSTNGAGGPLGTGEDWFRFTLGSAQDVTITVAPTGGQYTSGQQSSGCDGAPATVNATQAGNLRLELRDVSGASIIQAAPAQPAGTAEVISAPGLSPGTYTVRVVDLGPNPPANQVLQLYDLTIRVAGAAAPPRASAGLSKRFTSWNSAQGAYNNCWFMGDVNSRAAESSATIVNYEWDFDGDGVFDATASPQAQTQYFSNGLYPVTLRITDSNGLSATDTIQVTVVGAVTRVDSVTPTQLQASTTVPVIITGANLKNLTSSSMVTVSGGGGVTVVGTPVPNPRGTSVSGLSFQVAPDAPLGPRNVIVANADGSGTGVGVFQVVPFVPPPPGGFSLVSPQPSSAGQPVTPTLAWSAASGATSYTVTVATDAALANIVAQGSGLTTTSWTVSPPLANSTTYFWGVRASNAVGNTASTPSSQSFTTVIPAGPGAFSLSAPAENAQGVPVRPTLSWSVSPGANRYTVLVARDPQLNQVAWIAANLPGTSATVSAGALTYNTRYYWAVTAANAQGTTPSTPASRTFVTGDPPPPPPGAFNLLSPADNASGVSVAPTLVWQAANGAATYNAFVATDVNITNIVAQSLGISGTSWSVPFGVLAGSTRYYWYVEAVNSTDATACNAIFSFTTGASAPPAPGAFSLTAPGNGASIATLTPTLTWGGSAFAATYSVTVATDPGLSNPVTQAAGLIGTSWAVPAGALANGVQYFWGVTAVNPQGSTPSTPAAYAFITPAAPPPGPFNLSSPAAAALAQPLTPTLSWTASSGAASYSVTVATDDALNNVVASASGVAGTSWAVPAGKLNRGTRYVWSVSASNAGGVTVASPATRLFYTLCTGDVDGNGAVGANDLTLLLVCFGQAGTGGCAGADIDGNGSVGANDLTLLLVNFGCPF
ncbi:MAG: matrixin family metalloprotease [Phycisphaerales bacterium]|nr:matrixin family metalloprotease [Phycisphaerales bacterium]